MNEICRAFGEHEGLVGILTIPIVPIRGGLVLVNAGLVPKAGPYRIYAELARRLAREGIVTLRFDASGLGDSPHASSQLPLPDRIAGEIRAAVDQLLADHPGLRDVFVGGLCSGAEDAFRYAEIDSRITGAILVDPFAYRTRGWAWRNLAHRATRRTLQAIGVYEPVSSTAKLVTYRYMPHAEASRILRAMIERRARIHVIYTGGHAALFNHERQLEDMFEGIAFAGCVELDVLPRMDHTQLFSEDRTTLVETVAARFNADQRRDTRLPDHNHTRERVRHEHH